VGFGAAGSIAALAFALTAFTTEATATNNPESERANDRLHTAWRAAMLQPPETLA
jgi:hypothetical protein